MTVTSRLINVPTFYKPSLDSSEHLHIVFPQDKSVNVTLCVMLVNTSGTDMPVSTGRTYL